MVRKVLHRTIAKNTVYYATCYRSASATIRRYSQRKVATAYPGTPTTLNKPPKIILNPLIQDCPVLFCNQ